MSVDYTLNELMIIEAARHIRDGETVFVGTGMPMVAAMYAQKTHARHMCFVIETGPISPEVLPVPTSVSDPKAMHRAAKLGTLREVLGCILQRGMVDVGFLGGAQIDPYGNLNSVCIGNQKQPKVRLVGAIAQTDHCAHARHTMIIVPHDRRVFVERVDFISGLGFGDGPGYRERFQHRGSGPGKVVTNLAVLGFNPTTRRMRVESLHPGVTKSEVGANTGFALELLDPIPATPAPTAEEIRLIRTQIDPKGLFLHAKVS